MHTYLKLKLKNEIFIIEHPTLQSKSLERSNHYIGVQEGISPYKKNTKYSVKMIIKNVMWIELV